MNDRGFTLLEALAVLSIIAVLAALAMPSISSWGTSSITKGVVRGLVSDIRLARQRAINTGQTITVKLSGNEYSIQFKDGSSIIKEVAVPNGYSLQHDSANGFSGGEIDLTRMGTVERDSFKDTSDAVGWLTVSGGKNQYRITVNRMGRAMAERI